MTKLLIGILVLINFSAFSSDLQKFCNADPTGELYSEVIDSDIADSFVVIGLESNKYKRIIMKNPNLDLFSLAAKVKQAYPEIANALTLWKLRTCITRGYEMLTGNL